MSVRQEGIARSCWFLLLMIPPFPAVRGGNFVVRRGRDIASSGISPLKYNDNHVRFFPCHRICLSALLAMTADNLF